MYRMSIRYKIAIGYTLLMVLLIVTMGYIYSGVRHITGSDENDNLLRMRRRITNEVINNLNNAEIIGQSIIAGETSGYPTYRNVISVANEYIDSLRCITDQPIQLLRLDTVVMLMEQKDRNMRNLLSVLRNNESDRNFNKEIEAIQHLQDSFAEAELTRERVIVRTKSEIVSGKPKSFFKRIREVFSPSKKDSIVVRDTIYEVYTDTLNDADIVADTIASILRNMQSRASDNQKERLRKLNLQVKQLGMISFQLNSKVQQLLKTIEEEDRMRLEQELYENEHIRRWSAAVISVIAVVSLLIAGFLLFLIWRDITRSNHYRNELEKAKQHAEELLEAKEKLMLTITHDIKAPAGAVLGYLELLGNIVSGERQQFYLKNIQEATTHLLQLVTSLLDFHRLDSDKADLKLVVFNAKELFSAIIDNNKPLADSAGLTLTGIIDNNLDTLIVGDSLRLRQIIENLLSNALKFTSKGFVEIRARLYESTLQFSVTDTGCGMSDEEQELIYREFMRLPSAQGKEGFGLGLAITNRIVDLLGGEIFVESRIGFGTTFKVSLPFEYPVNCNGNSSEKLYDDTDIPSAELLLIDDDTLQLNMIVSMLADTPINTTCCTHPDELFMHLKQNNFDILFTDIQMPAINGVDLISRIRESGFSNIPVVAMTARSDINHEQLKEYGFSASLHKPFTRKELFQVLSVALKYDNIDFVRLTEFADNDMDAVNDIMTTFVADIREKRKILAKAMQEKDIAAVTTITHQLMPIFVMVGVKNGKEELEWFELRRDITEYTSDADKKIIAILEAIDKIIDAAVLYKEK